MSKTFETTEPARADIDARTGSLLLEFGSHNCGHCRRAEPLIEQALAAAPGVAHMKIADGPGQPLGRSFGVRLWPTLVFLQDGVEKARVVRPERKVQIDEALRQIATTTTP
ncbi:MAG: thioredoxin family protein [Rubrivivax sp.]|nr:thioredoxin family protein [Rubrivivax sp.]